MSETNTAPIRPRRSCLYMPGDKPRVLEKAAGLPADMLILDLEDAVSPANKADARQLVADTVSGKPFGSREVVIRVNGLDSGWVADDVATAVGAYPDGVLFPKINSADDVQAAERLLAEAGAGPQMLLWAMIETPLAILNLNEIAAASSATRLAGFVVGTNDLAKETGARMTADRAGFVTALSLTVAAARAYGLAAIDGVFNAIADIDGFASECEQGRDFGFDGKTVIHPSQIDAANRIFAPDPAEVERAHEIVAAFALPENANKGVIQVGGAMTERLHWEQAKRLIAMDEAISRAQSA